MKKTMSVFFFLLLFLLHQLPNGTCLLTKFSVHESAPTGFQIGHISGKREESTSPKYFVVFPDEQTSKFLKVDEKSGEITTVAPLDYEKRSKFEIVAVKVEESGETLDILVEVIDENDNSPNFADDHIKLEISEFAQLGTSFALPTVTDGDGPQFDVHRFVILQGNVNNVFKLTPRKVNEQLQADLVVNGQLDREFRDKYELLIEAQDGGKPAKTGQLRCSIEIIDANDNAPVFTRSRYTASVSANISIGSNIITVQASDSDIGENSRITYEIKKTASPSNSNFQISPNSGVITTTAHLLPASTHDVIVTASDHGTPPLTSSAVVTISVMGSSLASPPLDIIWLVESNSAHLPENSTLGSIVARVSIASEYRDTKLRLVGTSALCPQQTDQSHVYLLLLCGVLDRETTSEYHLKFLLEKAGQTIVEHPQLLTIGDINDNAPQWPSNQNQVVHISLNRTAGGSRTLTAKDPDLGQNGWIKYTVLGTELISIDKETGRIFVPEHIDCSVGSEIKFRIRAEDGGSPPLATDLQVVADLLDAESKPPQFEKALWQVEIAEDTPVGTCLVKVVANNTQCGSSKRIRYSMLNKDEHLSIDSMSGTVCIQKPFDYETSHTYQTTVVATNSNSETSTSLISIGLKDVNDNWPTFYPNEYHLTIREGPKPTDPLLIVSASDLDAGKFSEVSYQILSESASFSINSMTGEVFAKKSLSKGRFHLIVTAKDGGAQTAENPANVHITVIDKDSKTPEFSKSKYEIKTTEDILPGIAIGSVFASSESRVKYSIYSGDPDHNFSIDENTGKIYVTRYLDADVQDTVLLNIQAVMEGGQSNQTQVLIRIEDHNDNAPTFAQSLVEIYVKEDAPINDPFYAVMATDKDKKKNGEVRYSLISTHPSTSGRFQCDEVTGEISTTSGFDYEIVRDFKIRIKASDLGIPPKASNMTLFVHVLDVNDNSPEFERSNYFLEVLENAPPKTIIGKVMATDKDSGENGQLGYRITNGSEYFGIDEKLGVIYTKRALDRETISHVEATVTAEDKGSPSRSGSAHIRVTVLDVNDNPPSCHSITPIVVPANAPPSTSIGTIVATDPDKGLNGSVLYRAQLQSNLFVIKANGDVYLRRQLNASEEHHQRLSVIVSDQGTPRKSTVCHVAVRVAKGSSSIVLREPIQRFVPIPENCKTCRLIGFNATGVEFWQLQSSDISNHFQIRDGVLSLTSHPSHRPPYSLVVIMSDKNGRQKSIQIRIIAGGSGSKGDGNREETIRVQDTTGIGSKIGRLGEKASDIFYRAQNASECPLELDQSAGVLYLAEGVRYQSESNVSCYFEKFNTTDGTLDEMRVDLEITRSKSEKPQFDSAHITVTVREDTPTGTIITTVNATANDDSTTPISYRFTSQVDTFAIDQFTGDITLVEQLHWHVRPTHQLLVEAFTNGISSTVLVTVEVEDCADHKPFIISQPNILLPSSFRKGTVVHRVVAMDLDQEPRLEFSFLEESEHFEIDKSSGEVRTLRSSSEIEEIEETLTVKVLKVLPEEATFKDEQKILIKPSNSSKKFWHYFDTQHQETIEIETVKDSVVFEMVGKGAELQLVPKSKFFELKDHQVILKSSNIPISSNPDGKYHFTLVAQNDEDFDFTTLSFKVNSDTQDTESPKISSTSCGIVTLLENQEHQNFKRIMATGLTENSKFRFQGSSKHFTIDPVSGCISASPLDRELAQEHLLVVILTDSQGKNDSCTVRVQVADVNDNAPMFAETSGTLLQLNESSQLGDVLFKFSAKDMDIGLNGKISFELVEDPSKSLDLIPETGALVLRRWPRNIKKDESFKIKVKVFDSGTPSLSSDTILEVLNQRDLEKEKEKKKEPEVEFLRQSYTTSIDESLPRGQFVGKVETSSGQGENTPISYSIVEGNLDSAFSIDADGIIRTNLELDREIVEQYNLKVIGIEKTRQISTRIDVRVNNLNDNVPSFPLMKPRRVSEGLKTGSYVASVAGKDIDQLNPLEYSIDGESEHFEIDKFTGVIHLSAPLDFETCKEHTLKLKVTDGAFSTYSNLTVFVTDVNDNAPKFTKPFYTTQISPIAFSPGVPFAKIEAHDADSGNFGAISYSLEESKIFKIAEDGALFLKILPPSGEHYLVTVIATDGGGLVTSVPVSVAIGEMAPTERPAFQRNEFRFEVLENTKIGVQIGNVSGNENQEFQYQIKDTEAEKTFKIDRFGRLFVTGPIDRELQSHYEFHVEIDAEMTSFGKSVACKVHIVILDENDNQPMFSSSIFYVSLKDSMSHGQSVGQLVAHDPDLEENGRVTFKILTGNDLNILSLNSDTGALQFNEWNDAQLREHPNATWQLLVEARDHGHPFKSSIAKIIVSLKMASGSAPFFVLPSYELHVLEDTPMNTMIQRVRASNRLGMPVKGLLYSLKEHRGRMSIDVKTGELFLKSHLDWESEPLMSMYLSVSDGNGRSAVVPLKIMVEPVDEFAPVFTKERYKIQIPISTSAGDSVGQIQAIDEDGGPHGVVKYAIADRQNTVTIEESSGVIRLRKSLATRRNVTIEQFTVVAYSSQMKQSKATVILEIGPFDTQPTLPRLLHSKPVQLAVAALILLLLLLVVVICVCICRSRSKDDNTEKCKMPPVMVDTEKSSEIQSQPRKPSKLLQKQVYSVKTGEIRTLSGDISKSHNSMTSSTSSDALRMIRGSSRSQMDSGIDPDNLSINSSVTDYLVSLGVNANPIPPRIRPNTTYDSLMNEYIYARVEDVLPPGPISLSTPNQHSLLRQPLSTGSLASRLPPIIPSFEPITEIFKETIERRSDPRKEYVQVEI